MSGPEAVGLYQELTDGLTRPLRLAELAYGAAERHPGLLPTRAQIDAERTLHQKDKAGLEIAQDGSFTFDQSAFTLVRFCARFLHDAGYYTGGGQ